MFRCICEKNNSDALLNTDLVKIYSQQLLGEANKHLLESDKLILKFSRGCVDRFEKRHGIRFRRVHGEVMRADDDAPQHHMLRIRLIIMVFHPRDIFNADKFGLFYRKPPSLTLSNVAMSGKKKDKSYITFLACCNADGSGKIKMMIIISTKNPRAF